MSTCGECRFKGKLLDAGKRYEGFFFCERIEMKDYQKEGDNAFAVDGSGYRAAVCVNDKFGCLAFEKKDVVD